MLLPPVIMLVNYSLFQLRVRSSTRPLDAASVVLDVVNQEWQDKAREKADHPLVYSETKRRWVRLKDEARRPGCEQITASPFEFELQSALTASGCWNAEGLSIVVQQGPRNQSRRTTVDFWIESC